MFRRSPLAGPALALLATLLLCTLALLLTADSRHPVAAKPAVPAAAGDLDPSFGTGGFVTTPFSESVQLRALALQTNGKIVAAGTTASGHFALTRYYTDGNVDRTFGNNGQVLTAFPTGGHATLTVLALQADRKILALGHESTYNSFDIARYNPDGTLDTTFGEGGLIFPHPQTKELPISQPPSGPESGSYYSPLGLQLQAEGTFYVVELLGSPYYCRVLHFLANGTPDPNNYIVNVGTSSEGAIRPQTLLVEPGNKLLVAATVDGSCDEGGCYPGYQGIPRFGFDGRPVPFYGYMGADWIVHLLRDQPSGNVLGLVSSANTSFLTSYGSDGTLDTGFASMGILSPTLSFADLLVQSDGRILGVGNSFGADDGFHLVRYLPNGVLDSGFGQGGSVTTTVSPYGGYAQTAVMDANGALVVAGVAVSNTGGGQFAVARYLSAGGAPPTATGTATLVPSPTACTTGVFSDVPSGSTFYPYITCLTTRNIVNGYSDCTYRPANPVTRGQMAKFIANAAGYSDTISATRQTFSDVPPTDVFWLFIERVAAHGVVGGYSDGTYRPGNAVTRGQVAKFVSLAAGYSDVIPAGQQTFRDVPATDVFWQAIERVVAHGVVSGYSDGTYRPANAVTRGQTAKFIAGGFFPACQAAATP